MGVTLDRYHSAGSQDGWVRSGEGGIYNPTSTTLNVGNSGSPSFYIYSSWFRFSNITIPKGSTVIEAYFSVKAETRLSAGYVTNGIWGNDVDDASDPTSEADYNAKTVTSVSIGWEPPDWVSGTRYNSPEIKTIIQEIIDRSGWASGNSLMLLWKGHTFGGLIPIRSYEGSSTNTYLHIEYDPPPAGGGWGMIPIGG